MKMIEKLAKKFVRHMFETWWNKVCAIALILGGLVPVWIDGDGTTLVILSIFAIPMFFAKEDWRK